VVKLLGHGAMGRVLLARDPVLDRTVAIKLLRDDLGVPPEQLKSLIERMRQEARASARVVHPNIVALHDMGEDPELGLYLVFEYVQGPTLKERLAERGPLGAEAAARLAREVGDALTLAHGAGVLHRDIKPENLILSRNGAKIADFGIARVPDSTLTRDGGLLGTPAYSAPEAIHRGAFSPQSDQFSFAATLYEAISGQRAFPGDDALAVATRIATEYPAAMAGARGLDAHVDSALIRGMDKDPEKRWDSCADFGRTLSEALLASPRSQMPTLPDQRRLPVMRSGSEGRGTALAIGGFVVGALLTGVSVAALSVMDSSPPPPTAVPEVSASAPEPTAYLAEAPKTRERKSLEPDGQGGESVPDDAGPRTDAAARPDASESLEPGDAGRPDGAADGG
ncbi:MAG TPA: serine/threonine-protein kinase, partial [Polyangiaceae bacterium]|nr:serine/threonine-protein kinase [Polyangiaceae bacterium]